jgi:hypothetical protein
VSKSESVIHSSINPRDVKQLATFDAKDWRDLPMIGISIPDRQLQNMIDGIGMDAQQALQTTASVPTPIQFLQSWLPGFVNILTAARKIDEFVGIDTVGDWEDEEIVQGGLELTGTSVPYTDYGNVPFSSWNLNFLTRTIVRFEAGMRVGQLEEARASKIRVNSADSKRASATLGLEIIRNSVCFFGYNSGDNNTYGYLNDPNLIAYTQFPATGTGTTTTWSTKTFANIQADLRGMIVQLRSQGQGLIDPTNMQLTLALAEVTIDYLSVTTDFGYSVRQWMKDTYPGIRIISAPELNGAHSSANVAYLYAETIEDGSTDNKKVFMQPVPMKFRVVGVQQLAKGYEEDYTNATAGVFVKRPFAVTRWYGN